MLALLVLQKLDSLQNSFLKSKCLYGFLSLLSSANIMSNSHPTSAVKAIKSVLAVSVGALIAEMFEGGVHIVGEICPRSDPDIDHMRYYLDPLKLKCTIGYGISDNYNFPMLNPHRQLCKYGPHLFFLGRVHDYNY